MIRRLVFLIALGAVGAFLFRTYAFEGINIVSDSMAPALMKDQPVMVNKFAYVLGHPQRGDVVMFDSPVDATKGLVKRIVALGGETIEIRRKEVFINGVPLQEPYVRFQKPNVLFNGDNIAPFRVPDGSVFVMGDNRDVSGDSRDWFKENGEWIPFLPVENILGRVLKHNAGR